MKKMIAVLLVSMFGFAFGCGGKAPADPAMPESPATDVAAPEAPAAEVPVADAPAAPEGVE